MTSETPGGCTLSTELSELMLNAGWGGGGGGEGGRRYRQTDRHVCLSFDASSSSVSLAESPPRDLQITAYK